MGCSIATLETTLGELPSIVTLVGWICVAKIGVVPSKLNPSVTVEISTIALELIFSLLVLVSKESILVIFWLENEAALVLSSLSDTVIGVLLSIDVKAPDNTTPLNSGVAVLSIDWSIVKSDLRVMTLSDVSALIVTLLLSVVKLPPKLIFLEDPDVPPNTISHPSSTVRFSFRVIILPADRALIVTALFKVVKLFPNDILPLRVIFLDVEPALIVRSLPCVVKELFVDIFPPNDTDLPALPVFTYNPPAPDKTRSDEISILPSSVIFLSEFPASIVTLPPVVVKLFEIARFPFRVILLGPPAAFNVKLFPTVVKLFAVFKFPPNVTVLALDPTFNVSEFPVVIRFPARLTSPLRVIFLGFPPAKIVISFPWVVKLPPKLRFPSRVISRGDAPAAIVILLPVVIKSPPKDNSLSESPVVILKVLSLDKFEPAWTIILWLPSSSLIFKPVLLTNTEPLRFKPSDIVKEPLKTVAPDTVKSPTISAEPAILKESLTCKSSLIIVCWVVSPR